MRMIETNLPLTLALALALAGALHSGGCATPRRVVVAPDDRMVSVTIRGKSGPLVVLESGLGRGQNVWASVVPLLEGEVRVLAYDRAGFGTSSDGALPRSAGRAAAELHDLLEAIGEEGPLVLVGHSYGGMIVRLFASRYPDEVAALVLVDATHEDFPAIEARVESESRASKRQTELGVAPRAARDEGDALAISAEEVRRATLPERMPVLVLSAGARRGSPVLEAEWERLQQDLAMLSANTRRVVIEGSGHEIPFDAPETLADAILTLVRDVDTRGVLDSN